MSTIVYRYGLLAPIANADLVEAEMRGGNIYRNQLVELERGRRAAVRGVQAQVGDMPALTLAAEEAQTELDAALHDVTKHRAKTRKRDEPESMKERVRLARAARAEKKTALNEARRRLKDDVAIVQAIGRIDERYYAMGRAARAVRGDRDLREQRIAWGTGGFVEKAHDQSRKMPLWDGLDANDPTFKRWSGEGTIAVQIQGGITADELTTDTQLRITPDELPKGADPNSRRSQLRRRMVLSMRIGSDGRAPIWARWPMIMHRPLPDGAVIKDATVTLRKHGARAEWSVQVTLSIPDAVRPTGGSGAVAINLGWRAEGDELRVCTYRGEDTAAPAQHYRLDADIISGIRKADELRSVRDREMDAARDALVTALAGLDVPEWLLRRTVRRSEVTPTKAQALAYLGAWRSAGRLAALVRHWRDHRFDGDEDAYVAAETWRYHDDHLWRWEAGQRRSSLRRRKDAYRALAARLAAQYDTLILDDTDYSQLARRPKKGTPEKVIDAALSNRQLAAVGELKYALTNAFRRRGGAVTVVSATDTSRICHHCGSVETYDAAPLIHHTCSACGTTWDQDDNHCRVMIERSRGAQTPGASREDESGNANNGVRTSKWAKAKAGKLDKLARIEAARKAGDEAAE